MKVFLFKIFFFIFLVIIPLLGCLLFLPDPLTLKTMSASLIDKHKLLKSSTQPTIILVGGSNVGLGLISSKISKTLNRPVINSAVSGWFGMRFILNDIKPDIKKNDFIVLCFSYSSYENTKDNEFTANSFIVPVIFSIYPKYIKDIDLQVIKRIAPVIPQYIYSKIKQVFITEPVTGIYLRNAYNSSGDFVSHWKLKSSSYVKPDEKCSGTEGINPQVISCLLDFKKYVQSKGAKLIIVPPAYQTASFDKQLFIIQKIDSALKKNNLAFIAAPALYKVDNKYIFDSQYHLNKIGAELNTNRLINDLSKVLPSTPVR